MEQRYTFIKTNEIKDDTMSEEERVEIEAVIEEHDMDASVDEEDLEDELEDINEVDNIHAFKKKHMYTDDYDGRPSDTEK